MSYTVYTIRARCYARIGDRVYQWRDMPRHEASVGRHGSYKTLYEALEACKWRGTRYTRGQQTMVAHHGRFVAEYTGYYCAPTVGDVGVW
jgi:hypothetical protein